MIKIFKVLFFDKGIFTEVNVSIHMLEQYIIFINLLFNKSLRGLHVICTVFDRTVAQI